MDCTRSGCLAVTLLILMAINGLFCLIAGILCAIEVPSWQCLGKLTYDTNPFVCPALAVCSTFQLNCSHLKKCNIALVFYSQTDQLLISHFNFHIIVNYVYFVVDVYTGLYNNSNKHAFPVIWK